MKIKFLASICVLLFLAVAFLPNVSFAQKKTTGKTTVKPTPTPTTRDVTKSNNQTKTAEKRLALVIGNANYQFAGKLRNPVNDARDMAATLRKLGFTVIDGYDLNLSQMEDKVRQFGDQLKAQKGVGLFYYAGHGIQFNGANYLIPIDANVKSEQDTKYKGLNLGLILDTLDLAANGFNLVILDACRNNPFARSWNRDSGTSGGLASTDAPSGTFISYATKPGGVAADGTGRNGTFTAELLKQIQVSNLNVEQTFKNVRTNVLKQTNNRQTPWESSSLVGDFYFSGQGNSTNNNSNTTSNTTSNTSVVTEIKPYSSNRSIPSIETIETNFQSNLIEDVIRDAKIFLENEPDNARINSLLGLSLFSKRQITEAIPYLEKAIALGEGINLRVFRLKKQALIHDELKDGLVSFSKDEFSLKIGKDLFVAKFAQLKEVKFVQTQSKDYAVYVKGDFLLTEGEGNKQKQKMEKDKEIILLSPQATTQQMTVGTMQNITVAFCKDCETWTKEIVRLINRCRTGEIQKSVDSQTIATQNNNQTTDNRNYSQINAPAENYFKYTNEKFELSIPTNWRNLQSGDITFAPENAYGKDGITHGLLVLFFTPKSNNLNEANKENIQGILSGNPYLSKEVGTTQSKIDGRVALITGLSGVSPVTKKKELVFLYSILLKDKRLISFAFVCPADEISRYVKTFQDMINSVRIKD